MILPYISKLDKKRKGLDCMIMPPNPLHVCCLLLSLENLVSVKQVVGCYSVYRLRDPVSFIIVMIGRINQRLGSFLIDDFNTDQLTAFPLICDRLDQDIVAVDFDQDRVALIIIADRRNKTPWSS